MSEEATKFSKVFADHLDVWSEAHEYAKEFVAFMNQDQEPLCIGLCTTLFPTVSRVGWAIAAQFKHAKGRASCVQPFGPI